MRGEMMEIKVIEKEVKEGLNELVKKGYLDKKIIKGVEYWKDSKITTKLLKEGKTREQIRGILKKGIGVIG